MTIGDKSAETGTDLSTLAIVGKVFNKHEHTEEFTCYTMTCKVISDADQRGNKLNNTYWHSNDLSYDNATPSTEDKIVAKAMADALKTDSDIPTITAAWKYWNDLQGYIESPILDVITPVE